MAVSRIEFTGLVSEKKTCDSHGEYTASRFSGRQWSLCPLCKAESDEKEISELTHSLERERLETVLRQSGVPLRFQRNSLTNYQATTAQQRKALTDCTRYVDQFKAHLETGCSMILSGTTGTGKTHLATAMLTEIVRRYWVSAKYTTIRAMLTDIKSSWGRESKITETAAVARYVDYGLLVVDEVGVQFDSEAEKILTFDVINGRYENIKPTLIISNYPVVNPDKSGPSVSKVLGERVIDRLRENGGKLIQFEWPSYRKQSNEATQ